MKFNELLNFLEIDTGQTVFVHSSWERLSIFELAPQELIQAIRARIGPSGLVCFPTYPWKLPRYPFDPKKKFIDTATPSQLGIVSEVFRRSPGVFRSANPWVPVACWGNGAEEVTDQRALVKDPFAPDSVFGLLRARNVRVVGLGVSLNTSSFAHFPDWLLRDEYSFEIYKTVQYSDVVERGIVHKNQEIDIVPTEFARRMKPSNVFELSLDLQKKLRLIELNGHRFFSYFIADFIEQALVMGRRSLEQGQLPCWITPPNPT